MSYSITILTIAVFVAYCSAVNEERTISIMSSTEEDYFDGSMTLGLADGFKLAFIVATQQGIDPFSMYDINARILNEKREEIPLNAHPCSQEELKEFLTGENGWG